MSYINDFEKMTLGEKFRMLDFACADAIERDRRNSKEKIEKIKIGIFQHSGKH